MCWYSGENGKVYISMAVSSGGFSQLHHLRSVPLCFKSVSRTLGWLEGRFRAGLSPWLNFVQWIFYASWLRNLEGTEQESSSFFLNILFRLLNYVVGQHTKWEGNKRYFPSFPNLSYQLFLLRASVLLNRVKRNQQICVEVTHNFSSSWCNTV